MKDRAARAYLVLHFGGCYSYRPALGGVLQMGCYMLTGDGLRAWRERAGLDQGEAAAALGVSRATINRSEGKGARRVSDVIELAHAKLTGALGDTAGSEPQAPAVKAAPRVVAVKEEPDARRKPRPYDFDQAPEFTRGLARQPASNAAYNASLAHDTRTVGEGWQRVPGCVLIVSAAIPDPIPFIAPDWAGPDAVLTASGRLYHATTGRQLGGIARDFAPRPAAAPRLAFQKQGKARGRR